MSRIGFIRDPLDIKLLVLYIMSRVAAPIDFDTLTDLSMRDSGVDYFLFAQEVEGLVNSGHLTRTDDGLYSITEKGRTNGGIMESSLPTVVRGRCNRALAELNAKLRRNAQVTAQVADEGEGRCRVELGLQDDAGPIFSLALAVPSQEQGQQIAHRFQQSPEDTFNAILNCLLQDPKEES